MDKKTATSIATAQLHEIIKAQPNLMALASGPSGWGKETAQFCIDFIETYTDWLMTRDK